MRKIIILALLVAALGGSVFGQTPNGAYSSPAAGSSSSSGSFVATLTALPCTPGVTPSVQLSTSPFGIYYCSATNVWSSTSDILKGVTCVGCKADLQAVNDATVTNTSANVTTTGGDVAFTTADSVKACFATSGGGPGVAHLTGKLSMAHGTFTFLTAHTGTCSVANAFASGAANNYFFWGTDDATALTAWWTALNPSGALCRSGILPGTAVLTSTNFGSAATAVCKTPITGAGNEGITVQGFGQLSSLIVMDPSFDPATCTGSVSGNVCLFGGVGISLYQFGVWGGERSDCPAAYNGKLLLNINTDTHIVNFEGLGWCASGAAASTVGIRGVAGSAAQQAGIILDGFGATSLDIEAQGIPITNSWFGDSQAGFTIGAGITWPSSNNTFGDVLASSNMGVVNSGGVFQSVDDTCYEGSTFLTVGIKVLAGGLANLTNFNCNVSGNTGGVPIWLNGANAKATAIQSQFKGGATAEDILVDNVAGIWVDIAANNYLTNRINVAGPCNWWTGNTIGCVGLAAQAANIGATTIVTSPTQIGASFGPNLYTAYYHINVTTAGTAGTLAFNLICNNGTTTFTQAGSQTILVTATGGSEISGTLTCHAISATAVQYSTTGIVTPGALAYTLDVKLRPT